MQEIVAAANLLKRVASGYVRKTEAPRKIGKYQVSLIAGGTPGITFEKHPHVTALELTKKGDELIVSALMKKIFIPASEVTEEHILTVAGLAEGADVDREVDEIAAGNRRETTVDTLTIRTHSRRKGSQVEITHLKGKAFKVRRQGPNLVIEPHNERDVLRVTPGTPLALEKLLELHSYAARHGRYDLLKE